MSANYRVMAEIEWKFVGDVDDPNWVYLRDHASFVHKDDDACEFIVNVCDEPEYHALKLKEMRDAGCTKQFINAYKDAAKAGARMVLFYY